MPMGIKSSYTAWMQLRNQQTSGSIAENQLQNMAASVFLLKNTVIS
jgi:hypothetical protein